MRLKIAEEESDGSLQFSQQEIDIHFLKGVVRRVSSDRLGQSFKIWFMQMFNNRLNVGENPLAKDSSMDHKLEHQYMALLIVHAIAMTDVKTKHDDLQQFLVCLASDESMAQVWQCVAFILFSLVESKVRHVMKRLFFLSLIYTNSCCSCSFVLPSL